MTFAQHFEHLQYNKPLETSCLKDNVGYKLKRGTRELVGWKLTDISFTSKT